MRGVAGPVVFEKDLGSVACLRFFPPTAAEQVLHSLLRVANVEEVKLLELREKKGGRGINLGKIAGAEAGAVQRWREAERRRRQRATSSSFKAELLELI